MRRALTLGIDRQAIVEDLLYGYGRVSSDGRTIAAPLAWYPRLAHASPAERRAMDRIIPYQRNGAPVRRHHLEEAQLRISKRSRDRLDPAGIGDAVRASMRSSRPSFLLRCVLVALPLAIALGVLLAWWISRRIAVSWS